VVRVSSKDDLSEGDRYDLPAPSIEGYTLAFHGDERANDLAYARAVGTHLNTYPLASGCPLN
jgi:hypothetical protein